MPQLQQLTPKGRPRVSDPARDADAVAPMTARERAFWQLCQETGQDSEEARSLLREARDLLWHGDHNLGDAPWKQCPGCALEQRIDLLLNDGRVNTEPHKDL